MKLYDSAFSPFARKVRMVLEHKGLAFQAVDGLLKSNHADLKAVNGRVEVPVLTDGDITVVNSADIVAYLEYRYPEKPVYPADAAARVAARAWERTADTLVDAVLVNLSYWKLLDRDDTMPAGLLAKARADMGLVYTALERRLAAREFVCGTLSIADIALFPHISAARFMEVEFAKDAHPEPHTLAWHHAQATHLRGGSATGPRLHRRHQGSRPGAQTYLLARRPHRVDALPRLSRLVLQGNRRRPRALARAIGAVRMPSRARNPGLVLPSSRRHSLKLDPGAKPNCASLTVTVTSVGGPRVALLVAERSLAH